jgi:hypothetical protein
MKLWKRHHELTFNSHTCLWATLDYYTAQRIHSKALKYWRLVRFPKCKNKKRQYPVYVLWFHCSQNFNYLFFQSLDFERTWWKLFHKRVVRTIWYVCLYYYPWVDTSASELLVPDGIIRPVVSVSALAWFIRHMYYSNLQPLRNVIINKTKVPLPQA